MPDVSVTWLGHAAFRIDSPNGKRIYVDPWLDNPKCPENEQKPDSLARPSWTFPSRPIAASPTWLS